MKRLTLICCCALVLAACNNASNTEETPKDTMTASVPPPPPPMPDSATQEKNWIEYMTPGEMHKMMASWNGNWDADVTMWHAADSPPVNSKLKTINKMTLGDRYQVSTNTGSMMDMVFEGQSTLAYDNAKKQFISTWIDNTGTGLMVLSGPWDAASKSITLSGKMVNPGAGDGREENVRELYKIIDENNHLMEMYWPGTDGKEFKAMEIKYTRKK